MLLGIQGLGKAVCCHLGSGAVLDSRCTDKVVLAAKVMLDIHMLGTLVIFRIVG